MAASESDLEKLKALERTKTAEAQLAAGEARAKEAQLAEVRKYLQMAETGADAGWALKCAQQYRPLYEPLADFDARRESSKSSSPDSESDSDSAEKKKKKKKAKKSKKRKGDDVFDRIRKIEKQARECQARLDADREAQQDKDRAHEKARELKRIKEDEDWEAEFAAALRDRSAKRLKKLADAEAAE